MYKLYIANKNYSSWSLRPWVLMSELRIAFEEHLLAFGHASSWQSFRKISPSGKVPCLVDGQLSVWDSLAIAEYLAERHAGIWPANASARAWARCAAAEMHAGFTELRTRCSMTCGVRIRLKEIPRALEREIARMSELWNDGLRRFGGPFLAGESFTAADAFFAPVAFRAQTYNLALDAVAAGYVARILDLRSMRRWYMQALEEKLRDEPHEADMLQAGTVLQDLRAT
ncbi:MAG TPA: glutathione S-transferase [Steroidobacteraceae bacterium]|jgi:glutathione S-transferase|nr:glutathione S-transferase [Steroidobacteraceae bacterium]